jgi:hypothetical protein
MCLPSVSQAESAKLKAQSRILNAGSKVKIGASCCKRNSTMARRKAGFNASGSPL